MSGEILVLGYIMLLQGGFSSMYGAPLVLTLRPSKRSQSRDHHWEKYFGPKYFQGFAVFHFSLFTLIFCLMVHLFLLCGLRHVMVFMFILIISYRVFFLLYRLRLQPAFIVMQMQVLIHRSLIYESTPKYF